MTPSRRRGGRSGPTDIGTFRHSVTLSQMGSSCDAQVLAHFRCTPAARPLPFAVRQLSARNWPHLNCVGCYGTD